MRFDAYSSLGESRHHPIAAHDNLPLASRYGHEHHKHERRPNRIQSHHCPIPIGIDLPYWFLIGSFEKLP